MHAGTQIHTQYTPPTLKTNFQTKIPYPIIITLSNIWLYGATHACMDAWAIYKYMKIAARNVLVNVDDDDDDEKKSTWTRALIAVDVLSLLLLHILPIGTEHSSSILLEIVFFFFSFFVLSCGALILLLLWCMCSGLKRGIFSDHFLFFLCCSCSHSLSLGCS